MEEILISQMMMNIKLIPNLEIISLRHPERILRISGYFLENRTKEYLEIIIFKGFSSSTTHAIETDPEKSILKDKCFFETCELLKAPITETSNVIRTETNLKLFLDDQYWL